MPAFMYGPSNSGGGLSMPKIVGGLERPGSPVEGTIWVRSNEDSLHVMDWFISETQVSLDDLSYAGTFAGLRYPYSGTAAESYWTKDDIFIAPAMNNPLISWSIPIADFGDGTKILYAPMFVFGWTSSTSYGVKPRLVYFEVYVNGNWIVPVFPIFYKGYWPSGPQQDGSMAAISNKWLGNGQGTALYANSSDSRQYVSFGSRGVPVPKNQYVAEPYLSVSADSTTLVGQYAFGAGFYNSNRTIHIDMVVYRYSGTFYYGLMNARLASTSTYLQAAAAADRSNRMAVTANINRGILTYTASSDSTKMWLLTFNCYGDNSAMIYNVYADQQKSDYGFFIRN